MKKLTILFAALLLITTTYAQTNDKPVEEGEEELVDPRITTFLGYSYLNAGAKPENLSLAVGAHLALAYMFNSKFGVVLDGSFHTKKENELRIMRAFLMGGVQYMLLRHRQQETRNIEAFIRLLGGLATDRLKYSYGGMSYKDQVKTYAIASGLGFSYHLWNRILLSLTGDYIFTHFNDDGQSNIRISGGVRYEFNWNKK
jgi:hypothetical protein